MKIKIDMNEEFTSLYKLVNKFKEHAPFGWVFDSVELTDKEVIVNLERGFDHKPVRLSTCRANWTYFDNERGIYWTISFEGETYNLRLRWTYLVKKFRDPQTFIDSIKARIDEDRESARAMFEACALNDKD